MSNKILQTATSYERPDSVFSPPEMRYKYLIDFYTNALEYNPFSLDAYYKLANAYYGLNDFQKSLFYFNELKQFAPFYANINYNISLCYFNLKNINSCIYYLKKEMHSNYKQDYFKRLYFYLNNHFPYNNYIHILKTGLWIEKNNPDYRSLLAYEYIKQKKYYYAIDEYYQVFNCYNDLNKLSKENLKLKLESIKNIGAVYYKYLNQKNKYPYYLELYNKYKNKIHPASFLTTPGRED
jgi:hypothetical protein